MSGASSMACTGPVRGLALCALLIASMAQAQPLAPADAPVKVMDFSTWLDAVQSGDAAKRSQARAATTPFPPSELPALTPALISSFPEVRISAERALRDQSQTPSSEWADGLLALDAALAAMLPPPPAPPEDAQPVLEAAEISQEARNPTIGPATLALLWGARNTVVECLGYALPADRWTALQPLYAFPELRRQVLQAMLRLRGPGWRSFLETRLLSLDESELLDLIPVYAQALGRDAVPALVQTATSTTVSSVFWACADALAEQGVAPAQLTRPRADFTVEHSRDFIRYTLRAANVQSERGACPAAQGVFLEIVERNTGAWSVRAALEGLANCGYAGLHRVALGYVNDPVLRPVIIALLSQHLSPEGEKALRNSWDNLPPLSQAAVLTILHTRNPEGVAEELRKAASSFHPALRYQAAILQGQTPQESDLWDLASNPPAWMQEEALQAYLALAEARLARGETEEARRQYLQLLEGGMPLSVEQAAIAGLGRVGNPGDKVILEQLSAEKPLRSASESAMVDLATRGGSVEERVEAVSRLSAKEVPQKEMDALVAEVPDPEVRSAMLQRAGFLPDGLVAGPVSMEAQSGMQQLHFPILPSPTAHAAQYSGQTYPWTSMTSCAAGSIFDIGRCAQAEEGAAGLCAYVVYEIAVPTITGVYLFVQHDDGYALWLNGKFQRAEEAQPSGDPGWSRVSAALEPGVNTIVVKVAQLKSAFTTGLRVTMRDGKPFDLTRQEMPPDPVKPVGVRAREVKSLMENLP
jgi:hypothetical protein